MNKKTISTYDRLMQEEGFKSDYKKAYKEFALSELLLALMDGDNMSVRKLAKEAGLSANTIQNIRSGKQKDIRLQSFKRIAQAYGYELVLEKEGERISVA
ncbi:MAG: DNA-binding Xre family transcriptional regulator [Candidatus Latescibacterota bacterium]|jgi:DNA-binding Xre family transcriptional regulator